MKQISFYSLPLLLSLFLITNIFPQSSYDASSDYLRFPQEKHLKNIRMLTPEGENAEAYLSSDNKKLIYQTSHSDIKCDQIFTMNIDGTDKKMVSTGFGKTTCSYFLPGDTAIIYASTHLEDKNCPTENQANEIIHFLIYSRRPCSCNSWQLIQYFAQGTASSRVLLISLEHELQVPYSLLSILSSASSINCSISLSASVKLNKNSLL